MANSRCPSPCLSCSRVRNPEACDNKNCTDWRLWFTGRWEAMRQKVRADMDRIPQPPKGVMIGGRRYIPPHQVREYLQNDPCAACLCRGGLCTTPCKMRRAWEETRKEVLL